MFISRIAPNNKFSTSKSRRLRRRKMIKSIHPELRCVFINSKDLNSPSPALVPDVRPPVPIVDWTKVNKRSLGNLPEPQMFPKLGCSNDPNIYSDRIQDHGAHGRINIGSIHRKERFPFGLEYGIMTDLGIISTHKGDQMEDPYNQIIQGHVWSRELRCWVVHARFPQDNLNNNTNKRIQEGGKVFKKPRKRKVESR